MRPPPDGHRPIRRRFAAVCLEGRLGLDLTQQALAERVGITRGYLSRIERGLADPTIDVVEAISEALAIDLVPVWRGPTIVGRPGIRDLVHARCSAYVDRRLSRSGLEVAREVLVETGAARGFIDLLAYDRRTHRLIVIEIKTRLDDLGELERQLGLYERRCMAAANDLGWQPRERSTWLLALASDEVERSIRAGRSHVDRVFPGRAPSMLASLRGDGSQRGPSRSLALIDPSSRRRDWLIRSTVDGRRSPARYRDYADAARRAA